MNRKYSLPCWLGLIAAVLTYSEIEASEATVVRILDGRVQFETVKRDGEIIDDNVSTFEMAASKDRFSLRYHKPAPSIELKAFALSDYQSIYASQIIRQLKTRANTNTNGGRIAVGRFDNGVMPQSLGFYWDIPEVLLLSMHATNQPAAILEGAALKPQFIPVSVSEFIKRDGGRLRTSVIESSGAIREINFWDVARDYDGPLEPGPRCWLASRIIIAAVEDDMPTSIEYEVFRAKRVPNGRVAFRMARYIIDGAVRHGSVDNYAPFRMNSYEPVELMSINDHRRKNVTGFKLARDETVPFDINEKTSFGTTAALYRVVDTRTAKEEKHRKRIVVISSVFPLTLLLSGYLIFRVSKRKPKI